MPSNIKVTSRKAYYAQDAVKAHTLHEEVQEVVLDPESLREKDSLRNLKIEEDPRRRQFDQDEGILCLRVRPGEALGSFIVNVQFEGKKGEPGICMEKHNLWMEDNMEGLKAILDSLGGDYEIELDAFPCPKAPEAPALELAFETETEKETRKETQRRMTTYVEGYTQSNRT